jgi:multiple sugar transport system permease protein
MMKHPFSRKLKKFFLGKTLAEGFIGRLCVYALLTIIGFVYLFPIIKMIAYSLKDLTDLVNQSWMDPDEDLS